jgi:hypothetical protein
MRYLASLAMLLMLAPGCFVIFDDGGGSDGDGVCAFDQAEPASAIAPQRNPETLTCESFGGGGCIPDCGPCPAIAEPTPPLPSWGFCFHGCESLAETDCAKDVNCRVVKDAACAIRGNCITDFLGCLPTDQSTRPDVDCFAARDGFTCSQSAACTAYHRGSANQRDEGPPQQVRAFATCAPEGKSPGSCFAKVTCTRQAPACPVGSRAGVAEGCYTGGCIPLDVCEPQPPTM